MKQLAFGLAAMLLTISLAFGQKTASRFDQKLTTDKQIVHVLNRLTFGARPGDVEQVRRVGIEKWIDQQLHPERITENAALEEKVKPLETLKMTTWQMLEKSQTPVPIVFLSPGSVLTPQQFGLLQNCSPQDREKLLSSLEPDKLRIVLSTAPPMWLEGLSEEMKQQAARQRQEEQQKRQQELRKMRPPLPDLLSPDQIRIANRGSAEEKRALLNSLDPDKRLQVLRSIPPQAIAELPEFRRQAAAARNPQEAVNGELIDNKLFRAIYSNRQLEEVLVDFWVNHFNIYNGKGQDRVLLTSFERDAIRPYVFGHFKDMLLATARHPAMLFYLDNWQSQVPARDDFPLPPGARRPGLNENYGRELLELHTLGVDGGYTQDDVIAVARAFTGWTIFDIGRFGEFQFNPMNHDRKEKVVLGHTIPAMGAEQDGLQVIDILAHHPSTAQFISKKLAQRFVADEPPQALIDRMAATFTRTDGDLRAVVQTMLTSVEFLSEGAFQSKLKSPLEMVVSAVRALNAEVDDPSMLAQRIGEMGQPLYGKVEPTGYPNTGEGWASSAGILARINFATALSSGQLTGVKADVDRFNLKKPSAVAGEILGMSPTSTAIAALEKGIEGKEVTASVLVAVVMSSPDFQRR